MLTFTCMLLFLLILVFFLLMHVFLQIFVLKYDTQSSEAIGGHPVCNDFLGGI